MPPALARIIRPMSETHRSKRERWQRLQETLPAFALLKSSTFRVTKANLCVSTVAAMSESVAGNIFPLDSSLAARNPHSSKTLASKGTIFSSNRTSKSSVSQICNSCLCFDLGSFSMPASIRNSNNELSHIVCNADMRVGEIRQFCKVGDEGQRLMRAAMTHLNPSARLIHYC